jgi:hypothetical protein
MANWMNPLSSQWDGDQLTVLYEDGVKFLIRTPERDRQGRLWAETVAMVHDVLANRARIDWLDQRQRVDFHAIAAMRDGNVPWQRCMVPIIALLERGPEPTIADEPAAMGPLPLSLGTVEPFPVDVFPATIQAFIREAAEAFPCPPDFVGVLMLPVLGTAIGHTRVIQIKRGWFEGAHTYTGVVALSGAKKSPALKLVLTPLTEEQRKLKRDYEAALERYEADHAAYEVKLAAWKGQKGKATASTKPKPPKEPWMAQLYTTDSTIEAMAEVIERSPRGILFEQDELAGWVRSMNQYKGGKGSDRQYWLSFWNGADVLVNRKNRKQPIMLTQPFVCVAGCLPPDILPDLEDERGREDGFLPRILFSYPDLAPVEWVEASMDPEVVKDYCQAVKYLLCLEPEVDGTGRLLGPKVLTFTEACKAAFVDFANDLFAEMRDPQFPPQLRGAYAKFEGYGARLALVLQLLRRACNEATSDQVDEISVNGAVALVDYFKSHARRVYAHLRCTPEDKRVDAAVAWIRAHGGTATAREMQMHKVAGVKSSTEAKALLRTLEDRGFGRVEEKGKHAVIITLR